MQHSLLGGHALEADEHHPPGRFTSFFGHSPERSYSPTLGINGLSPQGDDVIVNADEELVAPSGLRSPIGSVDSLPPPVSCPSPSAVNSRTWGDEQSPPAHILNIFSPSGHSEEFMKSLVFSPPQTASEPEVTDEELESFSLSDAAHVGEHDEFLDGMGGMEGVGRTPPSTFQRSPFTSSQMFPRRNHPFGGEDSGRGSATSFRSTSFDPIPSQPPPHGFKSYEPFNMSSYGPMSTQSNYSGGMGMAPPMPTNGSLPYFGGGTFGVPPSSSHRPMEHPRNPPPFYNSSHGAPSAEYSTSHSWGESPVFPQMNLPSQPPSAVRRTSPHRARFRSISANGCATVPMERPEQSSFKHGSSSAVETNFPEGNEHSGAGNEHPHGEHPSRTLFIRNISSSVDLNDLQQLFENYGPVRSMYTLCKHRGFIMVSYWDIRHAKIAMRGLQGKVLRKRKLDIHYSIPKDNPSEKDQNQGTLVVFNLDPHISKDDLRSIFGAYGEIKEIRETPNKRHHKFVEFYDVRCAEQAMQALNKTEIRGKKIKIEPSRPGGRKNNAGAPSTGPSSPAHGSDSPTRRASATTTSSDSVNSSGTSSPRFFDPVAFPALSAATGTSQDQNTSANHPVGRTASNPMDGDTEKSKAHHRAGRSYSLPPEQPAESSSSAEKYALRISDVRSGSDTRTTLMIKNIPNKYTQKMLLATVDETHSGLYDFIYLPIDFKNKCNVGYAFINFIDPLDIVGFYEKLHNSKWHKFNSEKVCHIAYARIQGKEALIAHFQNSSLMTEDKKCRPIIFYSKGPKVGQPAAFPVGSHVRQRNTGKEEKRSQGGRKPRNRSYSCK